MSASKSVTRARHQVLVLGDQLNADSAAFDGFDAEQDVVLMVEARREATFVPQHKHRLVLFFSAMRHFRDALRARGTTVYYVKLDDPANRGSFDEEIARWLQTTRAERLVMARPGDYRVQTEIRQALASSEAELGSSQTAISCVDWKSSAATPKGGGACCWRASTEPCAAVLAGCSTTGAIPRAASGTTMPTTARPSASRGRRRSRHPSPSISTPRRRRSPHVWIQSSPTVPVAPATSTIR